MSERTPGPWQLRGKATIRGPQGQYVGCIGANTPDQDAAFICLAVNSHDALVEALKEARAWMAGCDDATDTMLRDKNDILAEIDAALAAAELQT